MLVPKKSLSQNFLLDKNICKKISNIIKIKDQSIIEIGPGTGQLTNEIIKKKPKKIILLEKDKDLYNSLKKKYFKDNISIYNIDALDFDYSMIENINIISNLPYNISTKIIIKLLTNYNNINKMIFMVQKEVADKMNYNNKNKKNMLSFFLESTCDYFIEFKISNKVFYPQPKVQSSVIQILPKKVYFDKIKLMKFAKAIFKNKRKVIKNVINFKIYNQKINFLMTKRSEDLTTKELLTLFDKF